MIKLKSVKLNLLQTFTYESTRVSQNALLSRAVDVSWDTYVPSLQTQHLNVITDKVAFLVPVRLRGMVTNMRESWKSIFRQRRICVMFGVHE